MVNAIYASKFSLSSTSAMKIYINLEILEVAKIIDKCIFLKFMIKKKKSNKWHILTISQNFIYKTFSLKNFNDRNDQKHDPI